MLLVGAIVLAYAVLGSPWGWVLVVLAAGVELGELWFWVWLSKRRRVSVGVETLLGSRAVVVTSCHPLGQVRVQGELWRAWCEAGADVGDDVRVAAIDGLTLMVER